MEFSKADVIKYGFKKFGENPVGLMAVSAVAVLVWVLPLYLTSRIMRVNEFLGTMFVIPVLLVGFLVLMGYLRMGIDLHDGNSISFSHLFSGYYRLPDFLIGFLFYSVLVSVGLLLFVIPGIFLAVRFSYSLFYILQGDGPALESLLKSWKVTGGFFFDLLILYLILIGFNVSALFIILGLIATLPITVVATVRSYRKISLIKKDMEMESLRTVGG